MSVPNNSQTIDVLQINEEFRRCAAVPLESVFMSQLDKYTPKLLDLFSAKGGECEMLDLFWSGWSTHQELVNGTDTGEAKVVTMLQGHINTISTLFSCLA